MSSAEKIVIGTRGSALARWQADHITAELRRVHPGLIVEQQIVVTEGDRKQTGPVIELGGKGVWVKEIEEKLLAGDIDLAVHSLKDVPAHLPAGLSLVAIPPRADPRDAVVSRTGATLHELPPGSRVGTSSLRRVCQVRAARSDLCDRAPARQRRHAAAQGGRGRGRRCDPRVRRARPARLRGRASTSGCRPR